MEKSDITFVGPKFKDTIISLHDELTPYSVHASKKITHRNGGISNVEKHRFDNDLHLNFYSGVGDEPYVAEAFIINDKVGKTTVVNWANARTLPLSPLLNYPSKVYHFVYLDILNNANHDLFVALKTTGAKLSCDLCRKDGWKDIWHDKLAYMDYIFISDSEISIEDMKDFKRDFCQAWIYYHNSTGSDVYYNEELIYSIKMGESHLVQSRNVVGAGDVYASSILQNLVKNDFKFDQTFTEKAHEVATEYVRKQS